MRIIADFLEAISLKADTYSGWAHAHPKFGLFIVAALLLVWLIGLLCRWHWAIRWQMNSKLWMFDASKPEMRRYVQIALIGITLVGCLTMIFVMK